jgi:hypothetical protein
MGRGLVPHPGHLCPDTHGVGGRPRMAVRVYSFDSSVCTSVCSAGTLEKGGVYAGSSSGSSGILAPFIRWPEMLSLEIQLIPAAGFIWSLGRIWGDRKEITNLQTVLYCLCLGAMASDALSTGAVWDALILEAVNLAVFLLAHMRKCMRWIRISGIIMILVALYMTKAQLVMVGLSAGSRTGTHCLCRGERNEEALTGSGDRGSGGRGSDRLQFF